MEISLNDIFDLRSIKLGLKSTSKEGAFTELICAVADLHPEFDPAKILAAIEARENKMSTGIASGIAIPHAFYKEAGDKAPGIVGAIGISREGIEYGALDGKPVYAIFMLIIGERANHLHALSRICALALSKKVALIRNAKTPQDVLAVLSQFR